MALSFLLLENGDHLQLEDGTGDLLLEESSGAGSSSARYLTLLNVGRCFIALTILGIALR